MVSLHHYDAVFLHVAMVDKLEVKHNTSMQYVDRFVTASHVNIGMGNVYRTQPAQ